MRGRYKDLLVSAQRVEDVAGENDCTTNSPGGSFIHNVYIQSSAA
jgi:hypothetical protein